METQQLDFNTQVKTIEVNLHIDLVWDDLVNLL